MISAARDSVILLEVLELVSYYIRGLLPSTRDAVAERMRQLLTQEQGDILAPRPVARAESNTCRAIRATFEPSTVRSESKSSPLLVTDDIGAEYLKRSSSLCWSPSGRELELSQESGERSYWAQPRHEDHEQAVRVAQNLEALISVGASQGAKKPLMPISPTISVNLEDLVHRNQIEMLTLSEELCLDSVTLASAD